MTYQIRTISRTEVHITVERNGGIFNYTYNPETHRVRILDGKFTFITKN